MSSRTTPSKKRSSPASPSSPSSPSYAEPCAKRGLGKEEEEQMWEAHDDVKKFARNILSRRLALQQHSYIVQNDDRGNASTIVCMIDPSKPIQKEPKSRSMKDCHFGYQLIGSSNFARLFSDPEKQVKTMRASANRWARSLNVKIHFGKIVDGEMLYDPVTIAVAFLWMEAFFKTPVDVEYAKIMSDQAKLEYIRSFRRGLRSHDEWKARIAQRSQQTKLRSGHVRTSRVERMPSDPLLYGLDEFDDEEILNMHLTDPGYLASCRIGDPPSPCPVEGARGKFLDGYVLEDIDQLDDDGNFELSEGT